MISKTFSPIIKFERLDFAFASLNIRVDKKMKYHIHLDNSWQSKAAYFVSLYVGIPEDSIHVNSKEDLDCEYPVCIMRDEGLVVSGLCHAARQSIKFACSNCTLEVRKRKLESLLVCLFFEIK